MEFLVSGLTYALIAMAVAYVIRQIKAQRAIEPEREGGKTILVFGKFFLYIGLLFLAVAVFVVVAGVTVDLLYGFDNRSLGWVVVALFFAVPSIPILLATSRRVIFDAEFIQQESFLSGRVLMKWSNLEKAEARVFHKDVQLVDTSGVKVVVDVQMVGFNKFIETLRTKVSQSDMRIIEDNIAKMYRQT